MQQIINEMQAKLNSFDDFLQLKKRIGHFPKGDTLPQFFKEDQIFEEAHNQMLSKLRNYKNLGIIEKVLALSPTTCEFNMHMDRALNAMHNIYRLI